MRKLTEIEAKAIPSKSVGKQSLARQAMLSLDVGEIMFLERREWKQKKNSPMEQIRRMRKAFKMDFTCDTALDGTGWIIKRIK